MVIMIQHLAHVECEGENVTGVRFLVKGELGAIQYLLYMIPHDFEPTHVMSADLGYHSPKPRYSDDTPMFDKCEYLDGKPCFYDGSGLNAMRVSNLLHNCGPDVMWKDLEEYYIETFGELK